LTVRVTVLRPQQPADLPSLLGGDSPFDDFGPRSARATPAPSSLDRDGGLTVVTAAGDVAGDVSWRWREWGPNAGSRYPMIGIWLHPRCRGAGLGRQAQDELATLFFRHTTAHRVEACTDVENAAEQRALEGAGFQREGVLREAQWRDGTYHDCYLYACLRSDRVEGCAD
jgi:RimJ/RimL family protein N-acetyltransferase